MAYVRSDIVNFKRDADIHLICPRDMTKLGKSNLGDVPLNDGDTDDEIAAVSSCIRTKLRDASSGSAITRCFKSGFSIVPILTTNWRIYELCLKGALQIDRLNQSVSAEFYAVARTVGGSVVNVKPVRSPPPVCCCCCCCCCYCRAVYHPQYT